MPRLSAVWVSLLLFGLRLCAQPPCVSGNDLSTYEALALGCTFGPYTVKDFNFSVLSTGGGAVPITASDITVTTFTGGHLGLNFASSGFHVSGAESVDYLLAYTWDSPDIRGLGDVLDPGTSDIFTTGCVNSAFTGAVCPTTTVGLHVFQDQGGPSQLQDYVFIPGADAPLGIRNQIDLSANGGLAGFHSIENDVYLPEPAIGVLVAAIGLLLVAVRIRLRKA